MNCVGLVLISEFKVHFALEESTRDAATGVELLDVVHRQREEILALLRLLVAHCRDQHDGVAHLDDDRTGLAGDLARFQGDLVLPVLERLSNFRHD